MDFLLSGCAGQCKSAAATDALVTLNLRWCATSVIHQLYNDAETDCRVEMMQYKIKGVRPSKDKLNRWSIYTSPHHLARFANESREYVRKWTNLHKCRFESSEQCRMLITLQHRLQCNLNDAVSRSSEERHDRYTPEGVNMQFIDDLIRGNVYVIGGKRYYYSEEFANHSSTVTVPDLDGDTTAGEDSSPASFGEANSRQLPSLKRQEWGKERLIRLVLDEVTAVIDRYCTVQGIHSEEQRMLTMAVTTQMSQIGFANMEYSAVTTRQFVCEGPLQSTEVSLDITPDGSGLRVRLIGRKSEFSSYAIGYESTPPDVMFIPCGPGSSRTLSAEVVWKLRTPQRSSLVDESSIQRALAKLHGAVLSAAEFRVIPRADLYGPDGMPRLKNMFEVLLVDGQENLTTRPPCSNDWHWRRILENSLKISL